MEAPDQNARLYFRSSTVGYPLRLVRSSGPPSTNIRERCSIPYPHAPLRRPLRRPPHGILFLVLSLALSLGGAHAVHAQNVGTEALGDALMRGMPVVTLGSALAVGDLGGAKEFLLGFGVNVVATEGLKLLVHKERPNGSDAESFPSGHTSIAFQSASFLHLRYGLRYGAPAYAAAAFVGYSRVHARTHFVSDVLVGAALGVASSALLTDRRREDGPGPASGLSLRLRVGFGSGLAAHLGGGVY